MLKRMMVVCAALVLFTGVAATAHADGIVFTNLMYTTVDVTVTGQKMTPQGVVTKKVHFTQTQQDPEKQALLGEDYRLTSVKVESMLAPNGEWTRQPKNWRTQVMWKVTATRKGPNEMVITHVPMIP